MIWPRIRSFPKHHENEEDLKTFPETDQISAVTTGPTASIISPRLRLVLFAFVVLFFMGAGLWLAAELILSTSQPVVIFVHPGTQ